MTTIAPSPRARKCGRCGESLGDAGGPPNVRTCDRCRSEVAEEKEAARKVWEAARAVKRAESEARVAAVAAAPPKKMGRPRGSQNAEAKAGEANRTLAIRSHLETALWMREHEIRERFKERAPVTTS